MIKQGAVFFEKAFRICWGEQMSFTAFNNSMAQLNFYSIHFLNTGDYLVASDFGHKAAYVSIAVAIAN